MSATADARPFRWRKFAVTALVGAVFGAAGSTLVVRLVESGSIGRLTLVEELTLLVALVYFLMGLGVGFGAISPRIGAKFLNVEEADELREGKALLVPSAIGCILLAVGLAALALAGSVGALAPEVALVIFFVSAAVMVWLSLQSARNADELMREVMREGAAAGYYFAFAGIGGWAVLAHLGFVAAPAMLGVVTLFYALTLVGCFWAVGRRGMLVR